MEKEILFKEACDIIKAKGVEAVYSKDELGERGPYKPKNAELTKNVGIKGLEGTLIKFMDCGELSPVEKIAIQQKYRVSPERFLVAVEEWRNKNVKLNDNEIIFNQKDNKTCRVIIK